MERSIRVVAFRKLLGVGSGRSLRHVGRQRRRRRRRRRRRIHPIQHPVAAGVAGAIVHHAAAEGGRHLGQRRFAATPLGQRIDVVIRGVRVAVAVQRDGIHFREVVVLVGMEEVVTGDGDVAADVMLGWRIRRMRSAQVIVVVVFFRLLALDLDPVAVRGRVRQNRHDVRESVDLRDGEVGGGGAATGRWEHLRYHLFGKVRGEG